MVRQFLSSIGLETPRMHEAAYLLAGFALASQILALLRDRLLAGTFGAGHILDLYYAAFRVPDFLFATVASLLSLYALLPILSRLEQEKPGLMISFMRHTILIFFIGMGVVAGIAYIFAPQLIYLTAPGIAADATSYEYLLLLTRILLLQPILLGASNILANLTQLRHRFLLYSISPLLYNLGIIFGVIALYPRLGVAGLGWGVVLGALMHVLIQVPFFARERVTEPLSWSRSFKELCRVLILSIPRTLSLAAGQISLLALVALASYLAKGSISIFSFAFNLQATPLTIIGVSYSVAAFPTLSRLFAAGEKSKFVEQVAGALRHIIFWSIPATVLIIVLRAQIVRTVLGAGLFDWTATRLTAAALALFVLSLLAQSVVLVLARAYYAAGNTWKPLIMGILSVIVSIVSAYIFLSLFEGDMAWRYFLESLLKVADVGDSGVLALALGYALGPIVQCIALLVLFSKNFSMQINPFLKLFVQSLIASILGGIAAYWTLFLGSYTLATETTLGIFAQGFIAGMVGLFVIGLLLKLFKNAELEETLRVVTRKKATMAVVEPSDLAS